MQERRLPIDLRTTQEIPVQPPKSAYDHFMDRAMAWACCLFIVMLALVGLDRFGVISLPELIQTTEKFWSMFLP